MTTGSQPSASSQGSLLRAAGVMGIATLLSRILGLAREIVFAFLFGAGNATDAFNIAFRIPNLLRNLFAEGAMSSALVPTFTRVREEQGDRRAWRVAGLVFRALFWFVAAIAALGMIFAPSLVSIYASAYRAIPGKFELTVEMTRVLFPFFPLVALAAAFMGILNACGKFFLPAFASALFNLGSIVMGVALALIFPRFGIQPIVGMAYGVVFGGAVQVLCQLPLLRRVGYRWVAREPSDPNWSRDPALRQMLVLMAPATVGLAATQVSILINSILATSQAPGAVSWLNYAFRLLQFPIGIFGVSIASAALPRISQLWVKREVEGVSRTVAQSLRHVFAINVPAAAGLAFLGYPIIELLFQYGRFHSEDSYSTAVALAAYSLGLPAYSAVKVLVPACYALGNTKLPVTSSLIAVVTTITLNLILIHPLGYAGLAVGTSIAVTLNALILLAGIRALIRQAGGEFPLKPLFGDFGRHLIGALLMGAACLATYRLVLPWVSDFALFPWIGRGSLFVVRLIRLSLLIAEGGAIILILARFLGLRETVEVVQLFSEKLKKKLSRVRN